MSDIQTQKKAHLRMLGCRLNQSEIDMMARQLEQQGYSITDDPSQAELHIVNTCAVTNQASASSRKLIRELHRANESAEITVTGCYAHIAPDDIQVLPGVARVIDNQGKDTIVEQLTGVAVETFDHEPVSRDIPAGRTRAFIKVQDGCDNECTFCVTTIARGHGRSRSQTEVIEEINYLHEWGYQEAVLTGVHLGSYGHDLGDSDGLMRLVQTILKETDIPRLRLSSLEPWDLSPNFFALWEDDRLLHHIHLPLQSGCDRTLRRMRRNTNQTAFRELMREVRQQVPDMSVTSDVIVGFPGETEEEYQESKAFIEEMQFSGLHVFPYSVREGTPASRMRGQVAKKVKKARVAELIALSDNLQIAYAERFVKQTRSVLWEQVMGATEDGFVNVGYTDNYIRAQCIHARPLSNHITPVQIEKYDAEFGRFDVLPILEMA